MQGTLMSRVVIQTAATLALSAALVAGPKFVSTWKAPEAAGTSFAGKKVAALIISDDQNLRVSGEEALVRELAESACPGGIASYRIVPREELKDAEKARVWYEKAGAEGVVAMRLLKADNARLVALDVERTVLQLALGLLRLRLGSGLRSRRHPHGRDRRVETLIFSVPQNKLLWAA
jgi:hypothetical protein